jgi:ElaB/YqjD/DUF883 family membrane-anchored ribosome-binding protein
MPAANESTTPESDLHGQVRRLREQVDSLLTEKVGPRAAEAVRHAGDLLEQGRAAAGDQLDVLAERIRKDPLPAVGIALVVGFLIGRTLR